MASYMIVALLAAQLANGEGEANATRYLMADQDIASLLDIDWSSIPYGGGYPFVGLPYHACVVTANALSWTESVVLDVLDWEELVHTKTGNFRRPGEEDDVFPVAGTSLKWKYDTVSKALRYDFYFFGSDEASEWRFDLLKPTSDFSYFDAVGCVAEDCAGPGNRFEWEFTKIVDDNVYFTECAYSPDDCEEGYSEKGWEWCSWLQWRRRCSTVPACS